MKFTGPYSATVTGIVTSSVLGTCPADNKVMLILKIGKDDREYSFTDLPVRINIGEEVKLYLADETRIECIKVYEKGSKRVIFMVVSDMTTAKI